MELNIIYSVLGIIGGLICVVADLLYDIKGKDNKTIGKLKMINTNWNKMNPNRFKNSILLVMIGVPMCVLGGFELANKIMINNELLGNLFFLSIVIGCIGGFFIHTIVCIIPVIYQKVEKTNKDLAEEIVNIVWDLIKIPFLLMYLILILISSIIVIISILNGSLEISKWFILLTPMVLQLIGIILIKVNNNLFYEVPNIFMGSLGLGMYGLMALF